MKKNKVEGGFFRDVLALGGFVFYALVVARALVGPFWEFFFQLLIGIAVLGALFFVKRDSDFYSARALLLTVFTILLYGSLAYGIFASFVYSLLLVSSFNLGNSLKNIIYGVVFGIIGSCVGIYLAPMFL